MNPNYIIAIDSEWDRNGKLILVQGWGTFEGRVWYKHSLALAEWMLRPDRAVVFHNAKADIKILEANGYEVNCQVHDTYHMAKCVYENFPSYSLDYLGYHLLGDLHLPYHKVCKWFIKNKYGSKPDKWDMAKLPKDLLEAYGLKDVEITFNLFWLLLGAIEKKKLQKCYEIERSVIRPVMSLESNGITIDRKWVNGYGTKHALKIYDLKNEAKKISKDKNFNPNAVASFVKAFKKEGIKLPLTDKGNVKFDKRTRKDFSHKLIDIKNDIAKYVKITNTYCKNILAAADKNGIAHPNYQISFAATRRFSSRGLGKIKVNWQNIPELMRRAVIIPPGEVGWFFDYKGIENVLHIYFSKDDVRRKAYEADEDWNEYIWLAEKILKEKITKEDSRYKLIKSTKLGMNYGLGWKKYALMNDIPLDEAARSFEQVSRACPAIKRLQEMVASKLAKRGYVQDPFGYIYHGEPTMAYKVVAFMIQGCAAAMMKCALIRVYGIRGVKLRLTTHDDIFFTTKDNNEQWALAKTVKDEMTDFSFLFDGIPIRVDTFRSIKSWHDKERVEC